MKLQVREYKPDEKRKTFFITVKSEEANHLQTLIEHLRRPKKYVLRFERDEEGATCMLKCYYKKDFSNIREDLEKIILFQ